MSDIRPGDTLPGDTASSPAGRASCVVTYHQEDNGDIWFRAMLDVDDDHHLIRVFPLDYRNAHSTVIYECSCGDKQVVAPSWLDGSDEHYRTKDERHRIAAITALDHINTVMRSAVAGE